MKRMIKKNRLQIQICGGFFYSYSLSQVNILINCFSFSNNS